MLRFSSRYDSVLPNPAVATEHLLRILNYQISKLHANFFFLSTFNLFFKLARTYSCGYQWGIKRQPFFRVFWQKPLQKRYLIGIVWIHKDKCMGWFTPPCTRPYGYSVLIFDSILLLTKGRHCSIDRTTLTKIQHP